MKIRIMESKTFKGQKNPFELREHSSYRGSSCRGFFYKSLSGNFHGANEFFRFTETFEL